MNAKTKRHISAWVLLAVFVSMLTLSSFHVHSLSSVSADNCTECVKHHCQGHFGEQTTSTHDCVLCQFLTLPFLAAATVAVVLFRHIFNIPDDHRRSFVIARFNGIIIPRAPPSL